MPLAEFYVRPGGSPLNSGSTNTDAPLHVFASGDWNATTGVFTLSSGTTSGVSVGDYASIFDNSATTTGCICRITALTSTTLTLQIARVVGAVPATGTGNRTVRIGGAWASLRNIVTLSNWGRLGNVQGNDVFTRVNVQNGAIYDENSAINVASPGGLNDGDKAIIQGFSATPGDLGKAHIRGAATGSAYRILNCIGIGAVMLADLILSRNGATGAANIVSMELAWLALRCWFLDGRGGPVNGVYVRCFSGGHNGTGFINGTCVYCVASSNTAYGFTTGPFACFGCIAENNTQGAFAGDAGNGTNVAIQCVSIRSGRFNTRVDQTGVFVDCGAIVSSIPHVFESRTFAAVLNCGATGFTVAAAAPESVGGVAILSPAVLSPRTFSTTPYQSAPNTAFPKSLDLRPATGGGAGAALSAVYDVPSSYYAAIQEGFAQATATPANASGGAVDPLGGGLIV